jgi:hypothetical protein
LGGLSGSVITNKGFSAHVSLTAPDQPDQPDTN